jgi:uncharacterized protein YbbC (DUF1343 family)
MSEGRGTDEPFLLIGAPDLNMPASVLQELSDKYNLEISDTTFTPIEIPGRALRPKHQNQQVSGIYIRVPEDGYLNVDPVDFGHTLLRISLEHSPTSRTNNFLKRLAGTDRVMNFLQDDKPASQMWNAEVESFKIQRQPYLMY